MLLCAVVSLSVLVSLIPAVSAGRLSRLHPMDGPMTVPPTAPDATAPLSRLTRYRQPAAPAVAAPDTCAIESSFRLCRPGTPSIFNFTRVVTYFCGNFFAFYAEFSVGQPLGTAMCQDNLVVPGLGQESGVIGIDAFLTPGAFPLMPGTTYTWSETDLWPGGFKPTPGGLFTQNISMIGNTLQLLTCITVDVHVPNTLGTRHN